MYQLYLYFVNYYPTGNLFHLKKVKISLISFYNENFNEVLEVKLFDELLFALFAIFVLTILLVYFSSSFSILGGSQILSESNKTNGVFLYEISSSP